MIETHYTRTASRPATRLGYELEKTGYIFSSLRVSPGRERGWDSGASSDCQNLKLTLEMRVACMTEYGFEPAGAVERLYI